MKGGRRPSKKVFQALERVFDAEINGHWPYQSRAKFFRELQDNGLLETIERTFGSGWSAVKVTGYQLTHAGRYLYCCSCADKPEPEDEP